MARLDRTVNYTVMGVVAGVLLIGLFLAIAYHLAWTQRLSKVERAWVEVEYWWDSARFASSWSGKPRRLLIRSARTAEPRQPHECNRRISPAWADFALFRTLDVASDPLYDDARARSEWRNCKKECDARCRASGCNRIPSSLDCKFSPGNHV